MNPWPSPQWQWLQAMGFTPMVRRPAGAETPPLGALDLPPRLCQRLEHWAGRVWCDWPAPPGTPQEAAFKRALWRRVRDGRRRG